MSCSVFARASRGFLAVALAAACVPCAAFADDLGGEGGASVAASTSDVTVDSAALATLVDNLTARFATGGDYADLAQVEDESNYVSTMHADAAVALYQQGKGSLIDVSSLRDNYSLLSGAGQFAKAAIIFKAAGVDPSAVELDGVTHNVIADMELALGDVINKASYNWLESLPYVMYTYEFTGQSFNDITKTQLLNLIIGAQNNEKDSRYYGLFNGTYGCSTQTAAQIVQALIPFCSEEGVSEAIEKAVDGINRFQNLDGSFSEGYEWDGVEYSYASLDTTASVVAAYAALGKDTEAACAFLVNESAGSNYAGYESSDYSYTKQLSAATALMGLVAYQRAAETGSAYNMFDASLALATPATPASSPTPAGPATDPTPATETPAEDVLAPTGDAAGIAGACTAAGALGAGVVAAAALARARRRVA